MDIEMDCSDVCLGDFVPVFEDHLFKKMMSLFEACYTNASGVYTQSGMVWKPC